jgi:hypothetical protein
VYIIDLMRVMQPALLAMGYRAEVEESLQVRRLDLGDRRDGTPESDITIYDLQPGRAKMPAAPIAGPGLLLLPTPDALEVAPLSETPYRAIAIYALTPKAGIEGRPVAWIELLSPSNKGRSEGAEIYQTKRLKLLRGGLVFVEVDYLHETPPALGGVRNYASLVERGHPDAHPYRIAVIDPRPNFDDSVAVIAQFNVDEPIPTLTIPLSGDDALNCDFGAAYDRTYRDSLYGPSYVDYAEFPARFERYSPADQARIARRMLAVLRAARDGGDLETAAPLPVDAIPLDAALDLLAAEFDLRPEQS